MVTGLLSDGLLRYRQCGFEIARVKTCVCIWRRTPVGLKSDLVFRDRPGRTCTCVRRVLTVFNCSVLNFGVAIKIHRE
jgi:hypothetical protein